jgi:2,6-dihydroxypseudooxynicotine hydrolase
MTDDEPGAGTGPASRMQPDARVTAATAHWAARFTANGTDYGDFAATIKRITRWDDWCREWGVTARRYEDVAVEADGNGQALTAGGAWRRAALAWHWGKFVFVDHPDEQRAAHERAVACYRRGAATLDPPAQRVLVPYAGVTLAAYLRVPTMSTGSAVSTASTVSTAGAASAPPVVIMVPGLDSTKEELQATAEYFLARGLATIAIDGPGQGEAEYDLPIEPGYEKVATAVIDYLAKRGDVNGDVTGLFGVSLGGYYAARCAAYEPRVKATVALAGPYQFDLDWPSLPPQTRATFQARSRSATEEEARARAAALTLKDAAALITSPLLVVGGGRDTIVPAYHAERLAAEAPGAELLLYPDGSHGVTSQAFESRSRMADWLAARLAG